MDTLHVLLMMVVLPSETLKTSRTLFMKSEMPRNGARLLSTVLMVQCLQLVLTIPTFISMKLMVTTWEENVPNITLPSQTSIGLLIASISDLFVMPMNYFSSLLMIVNKILQVLQTPKILFGLLSIASLDGLLMEYSPRMFQATMLMLLTPMRTKLWLLVEMTTV
jgi:hypothetical protein